MLSNPPPPPREGSHIQSTVPAVTIQGLVSDKTSVRLKSLVHQQSTWLPLTARMLSKQGWPLHGTHNNTMEWQLLQGSSIQQAGEHVNSSINKPTSAQHHCLYRGGCMVKRNALIATTYSSPQALIYNTLISIFYPNCSTPFWSFRLTPFFLCLTFFRVGQKRAY